MVKPVILVDLDKKGIFNIGIVKALRNMADNIESGEGEIKNLKLSGNAGDPWYSLSFSYRNK